MQMPHLGAASVVNEGCQCKACFSTGSFIYGLRRSPRLCASRAQNRRFHARSSLCAVSRAQNGPLRARNPRRTASRAQNRLLHARNSRRTALAQTLAHKIGFWQHPSAQVWQVSAIFHRNARPLRTESPSCALQLRKCRGGWSAQHGRSARLLAYTVVDTSFIIAGEISDLY